MDCLPLNLDRLKISPLATTFDLEVEAETLGDSQFCLHLRLPFLGVDCGRIPSKFDGSAGHS